MRKTLLVLIIVVNLILLYGCRSGDIKTAEIMPGIKIPLDQMNVELQLTAPLEANTFKIGDIIGLVIVNLTNNPIWFPQNYGVKIFEQKSGQWNPIENNFGYPEGDTLLLPKKQELFGGKIIDALPSLSDDQPVVIRVFVIGKIQDKSSSGKEVGAYLDVSLNP